MNLLLRLLNRRLLRFLSPRLLNPLLWLPPNRRLLNLNLLLRLLSLLLFLSLVSTRTSFGR